MGGMLINDSYIIIFSKKECFMENTKKYLSTGLALALALFTSVQVSAVSFSNKPSTKQLKRTPVEQEMVDLLQYIADEVAKIRDKVDA